MKRVCVVCEGQTEEEFVSQVLAPAFVHLNPNLIPEMISTSPGHRGGALVFGRVKRHLNNTLRQPSQPIVTTMFDLYRLNSEFPGFANASAQTDLGRRLQILNSALHQDVVAVSACRPDRFVPYIQPYEFEALLFSDVETVTKSHAGWEDSKAKLQAVRNAAHTPEHINDGPETKPAAHLERHLTSPKYRKRLHGPVAAQKIGIAKMESQCPHFAGWLAQLRIYSEI
jgi:hypothetical protein